jgi:hypothetical protein
VSALSILSLLSGRSHQYGDQPWVTSLTDMPVWADHTAIQYCCLMGRFDNRSEIAHVYSFTLGVLVAVHKMSGAEDTLSDMRANELVTQVLQLR